MTREEWQKMIATNASVIFACLVSESNWDDHDRAYSIAHAKEIAKLAGLEEPQEPQASVGMSQSGYQHSEDSQFIDTLKRISNGGYHPEKFEWMGNKEKPKGSEGCLVVLDITLGTLQETFEFAWDWIKNTQEDNWRWSEVKSDPAHLCLLEGSESFKPFTLRWRVIEMNANIGKAPRDVRDPKRSPGVALLFFAAQYPDYIKSIDYEKTFGFYLPGLECTVPDDEPWEYVPCVDFSQRDRQVDLSAGWCGGGYDGLAVPVFREC